MESGMEKSTTYGRLHIAYCYATGVNDGQLLDFLVTVPVGGLAYAAGGYRGHCIILGVMIPRSE
jgi:hypothetical protein